MKVREKERKGGRERHKYEDRQRVGKAGQKERER